MKRQFVSTGAVLAVLIGAASAARGAEPATPPAGFRAEFIAEVDSVGKKLADLAGAMPAEKFAWRPAPEKVAAFAAAPATASRYRGASLASVRSRP